MQLESNVSKFGVVLVTAPSEEQANQIAQALVEARLAACVSMMPIHSIYTWQGEIHHDSEWQLFIKTNLSHFSTLEAKIKAMHPYEVPEIIALPIINGSNSYLQWIQENTNPEH